MSEARDIIYRQLIPRPAFYQPVESSRSMVLPVLEIGRHQESGMSPRYNLGQTTAPHLRTRELEGGKGQRGGIGGGPDLGSVEVGSSSCPCRNRTVLHTPAPRARQRGPVSVRSGGGAVPRSPAPRQGARREEESPVSSSRGSQGRMRRGVAA